MNLYRVVPFKRLQQIAEQNALAFVSYRTFKDDPHEASLIQALSTQDGVKHVVDVLKQNGYPPASVTPLVIAARSAAASAFMQCWTRTPEHNLMWDRYGDGADAVRMTMNDDCQGRLPGWISFNHARYEDSFDLWREIQLVTAAQKSVSISSTMIWTTSGGKDLGFWNVDFRKSLTFKLKAYKHENEVRLLTPILNDFVIPRQARQPAPWANHPANNKDVTLIPIGNVANVIASVMVGPRATADLQRDVEAFCATHGLVYEGKSMLMTRRYTGSRKIFADDPDD